MIDAGVEEDVLQQKLAEGRPLHVLRQTAITAPVIGHGPAAMRDDEFQGRKILEQIGGQELHEGGGVAVDVMRAGGVEVRVAGGADMHHRWHFELDHLLVERIPPPIGHRRVLPVAAGRVRVEIAADETQFLDAALEFFDAVGRRHARRLRQLADADEIVRIKGAEAVDEVVRDLRPQRAGGRVADMMGHARCARREDGEIGAALALQFQLRVLDALPQLVVTDLEARPARRLRWVLDPGDLFLAPVMELCGLRRVVPVTIDDHADLPLRGC